MGTTVKRNRRIIPLHLRKRVSAACDRCKNKKIKCTGGFPCTKCSESKQECKITPKSPAADSTDYKELYTTTKRYNCKLERIVQHLFPDVGLDFLRNNIDVFEKNVCIDKSIVPQKRKQGPEVEDEQALPEQSKTIENFRQSYVSTTDQSFLDFIEKSNGPSKGVPLISASSCETFNVTLGYKLNEMLNASVIQALAILPSEEKILKFIQIYLNICETNYFYACHIEMYEKLKLFNRARENNDMEYFQREWSFLLIVLAMLSIASGFEYMGEMSPIPSRQLEVNPGFCFYLAAMPFVGFSLESKSIESIQALLVLGVFMTTNKSDSFQISDSGYSLMNVALDMAIYNKLYSKETFKHAAVARAEKMKRLWWSCYTLERRHGINLGRPEMIRPEEITVGLPEYCAELRKNTGATNYLNQRVIVRLNMVFIKLTKLEFTKSSQNSKGVSIDTKMIKELAQEVENCRSSFPEYAYIENLDPSDDLYRGNIHLHLNYFLAKIYIGKPFLLYKVENQGKLPENSYETSFVDHLTSICVDAAFCSIELLTVLEKNSKLGLFSFTDINFCNISLFVILVYLRVDKSDTTLLFLKKGLDILKTISRGSSTAKVSLEKLAKFNQLVSVVDKSFESESVPYNIVNVEANGMTFPELPSDIDSILQLENFGDFENASAFFDANQVFQGMDSFLNPFEDT
ncbi:putative proline-induction transcriptional activator [Scheffersomyces xylosifermentans]|uniref:putative proline-induction transcriptional activator n=1 Tax=Scheffersomyces xylosifermentans TaxID=1304137 RepID=UPI00315C6887